MLKAHIARVVIAVALPYAAAAATYYASPDGTGTGTSDSPCSLADGINKVKMKSHTLVLRSGRYLLESPVALNGTSEAGTCTTIRGETGDPADVVLDAQGLSEAMRINRNILVSGITISNGCNESSSLDTRAAGVRVGYNQGEGTLSVVSNCVVTCCTNAFTAGTKSGSNVIYGGAVCVYDTGLLVDSVVTNNTTDYRSAGVVVKNGAVRGCTISGNAAAKGGGGVFVERGASALVSDCTISGNAAGVDSGGGGAACFREGRSLTLTNCVISGNTARYGGGVDSWDGTALRCVDCRFEGNVAGYFGGGVRASGTCRAEILGCVFDGNRAEGTGGNGFGGALAAHEHAAGAALAISNCVFRNNYSASRGGAVGGAWGTGTTMGTVYADVVDCVFTNNSSASQGGAVCLRDQGQDDLETRFRMRNCLVALNKCASGNGGGVYFVAYASPVLDSCTIVSNASKSAGAGIYHRWGGTVTNCVIAFNLKAGSVETEGAWCLGGGEAAPVASAYRNCCAWPALEDVFLAANGCVNADPKFTDAAVCDFTPGPGSPCRNAGVMEDWMENALDLAGNPRISGSGVDIGCYESLVLGMTIYIK